jgi:hypothetical protein
MRFVWLIGAVQETKRSEERNEQGVQVSACYQYYYLTASKQKIIKLQ